MEKISEKTARLAGLGKTAAKTQEMADVDAFVGYFLEIAISPHSFTTAAIMLVVNISHSGTSHCVQYGILPSSPISLVSAFFPQCGQ